jgi:hypothetical protein
MDKTFHTKNGNQIEGDSVLYELSNGDIVLKVN